MYNKGLFSFYTSLMLRFHSVYTSLDIIVQSKIYSLLVVMLQYLMTVSLKQQEKAISVINLWFMTSMNTFRRVQDPSGFQCTITTYLSIKMLNTINKRNISTFIYVLELFIKQKFKCTFYYSISLYLMQSLRYIFSNCKKEK